MSENNLTILIVDDEVRSLEALERNLADDFEIKVAPFDLSGHVTGESGTGNEIVAWTLH